MDERIFEKIYRSKEETVLQPHVVEKFSFESSPMQVTEIPRESYYFEQVL